MLINDPQSSEHIYSTFRVAQDRYPLRQVGQESNDIGHTLDYHPIIDAIPLLGPAPRLAEG